MNAEYRLGKYIELNEEIQRKLNETMELCETAFQNSSAPNDTFLSFAEKLSQICDFCFNSGVEELWLRGVCDHPETLGFHVCVYVFYTTILCMAMCGNLLVVYVVCSSVKMQTVTNFFIANLAVGDLCMAIFCVPFSFISILILQYWPFGSYVCVTVNYLQAVSVFLSAYTLVAMSIDRYAAIIYPLKPRMSRFQAKIIVAAVWTLSLVTTLPIAIFSKLLQPDANFYRVNDLKVCQEDWGELRQNFGAAYTATLMLLQYFLPIAVLIFTYSRIAVAVWGKKHLGDHRAKLDTLARSKRKTIEMMITCVTAYTLAWLPLNVYNILRDLPGALDGLSDNTHSKLFFGIHWLAMAHTCCNPVIYFWMNPKFRLAYLQTVSRANLCCRDREVGRPSPSYSGVQRDTTFALRQKTRSRNCCPIGGSPDSNVDFELTSL